jgi:hypothetical protein
MRHPWIGMLAGALGIIAAGVRPAAAEIEHWNPGTIVVRTYTPADFTADTRTARMTAGAILRRAGIEVGWIECGPRVTDDATGDCTRPLLWNEVVVRVVRSDAAADSRSRLTTLGFAFVDVNEGVGSLATVYADRVGVMAKSAGVNPAELLGAAIAHEIGHLLLGTNEHASRGLMRASWQATELRRSLASQWLLAGNEGERMRKGIAGRWLHSGASAPRR